MAHKTIPVRKKSPASGKGHAFIRRLLVVCAGAACIMGIVLVSPRVAAQVTGSSFFTVKNIRISTKAPVSEKEVLAVTGIAIGTPMSMVHPVVIEQAVEKLLWVKDARVMRIFPSTLRIVIDVRKVQGIYAEGHLRYIDQDGYLLPCKKEIQSLPLVFGAKVNRDTTGKENIDSMDNVRLKKFLAAVESRKKIMRAAVSQIDLSDMSTIAFTCEDAATIIKCDVRYLDGGLVRLSRLLEVVHHGADSIPRRIELSGENLAFVE